ncbi:MAG: hypothetical protein GOMPHAMPRED_003908 [Gomphillus americanus]|uniref:NAD(P)-binding protein n=1 Tax=Gomphillus americanus TaxID=1940652 RepID=A0A8H3INF4_9LECA|nr:MAG: hypothetical protein GOMPHAMPRED_003908 [Gomphillus americanus]
MSLTGKVVIITGGTKGIGAAISESLHAQGASIVATYASDASSAEELNKKLSTDSKRILTLQSDAGSIPAIEKLVSTTLKTFGQIDIVIPNAGILLMKGLSQTTESDFDKAFTTNVKGPWFLCQKAAPHMKSGGKILLLSTSLTANSSITPNYMLYNATKGAIEQMTRLMAKELSPKGISVNAIAPGPTATELFLAGKSEELLQGFTKAIPAGRLGQPEDIAGAVKLLLSDESGWIQGQVVRANGGMVV